MTTVARFQIPQREPCPFCENIAGRHPCAIVKETSTLLTFVNPRQYGKGALLLIPKRHVPTVLDFSEDEAAEIMPEVIRLTHAITKAFEPQGFNIFQNNGVSAGQSVPHYHIHIVPRYETASAPEFFSSEQFPRTPFEERIALAEQIKRQLESQ